MLKTLVVGFLIFALFGLLAGIWGALDKIRLMLEREAWKKGVQLDNITKLLTQNKSPYITAKTFDGTENWLEMLKKEYERMKEGDKNG